MTRGFQDHLDVTVCALVELRERAGCILERQPVTHDLAGPGCTGDNHVAQFGIPALVIVATHGYANVFVKELGPETTCYSKSM